VFIDKKEAITILDKAVVSFQQVQRATSDPSVLQQAGFGLGLCWETLSAARVGDDRTKAEEAYQKVIDQWEDSFAAQRASKQLAWIRRPSTVAFLELTAAKTVEPSDTDDFMGDIRGSFELGSDPFAPPGTVNVSAFGQGTPAEEHNNAAGEEPKGEEPKQATENNEEKSDPTH